MATLVTAGTPYNEVEDTSVNMPEYRMVYPNVSSSDTEALPNRASAQGWLAVEPTFVDPIPERSSRVVKKKKKKVGVIDAVVDATDEKVKRLKEKIKRHDTQLQMEEKELKTRAQHINTIKTLKKNLESKSEILSKKTKAELKAHYQSIIDRLTKEALIEKFDTDMYQRVIITTKPILVKGLKWLLPKDAGRYQIRIDFNIENWRNAIQILNITRHYNGYDSPTISSGDPCWGNIAGDIENEFNTQDLYELVIDLIDYIRSPDTSAGYLSNNGDKSGGWDIFFKGAKDREKNYSFEKYEENSHDSASEGRLPREVAAMTTLTLSEGMSSLATPMYWGGTETATAALQEYTNRMAERNAQVTALEANMRNLENQRRNYIEPQIMDPVGTTGSPPREMHDRLYHVLYSLGLEDNIINGISHRIIENQREGYRIRDIRTERLSDNLFRLLVTFESPVRVAYLTGGSVPVTSPEDPISEFSLTLDVDFLRPAMLRELERTRTHRVTY